MDVRLLGELGDPVLQSSGPAGERKGSGQGTDAEDEAGGGDEGECADHERTS